MKAGERLPQMPFFPNYILRDVLAWYVVLAVRRGAGGVLSVGARHEGGSVRRRAAGDPARVVLPGDVPHAEAACRATSWASKASSSACVAFGLAALFLVLVPFLDRRASRGERSPLFTVLAVLGLVY